jgi:hypothetical protein
VALAHAEKRMGDGMNDVLPVEISRQLVDVAAQFLEFLVMRFIDPIGKNVDFALILREKGGDFLADESIGQVGDLESAGDLVVIGDCDEVHASLFGAIINLLRRRVAFSAIQDAQKPVVSEVGVVRMHVQIDA